MNRFFSTPLVLTLLGLLISPLTADEQVTELSNARNFLEANAVLSQSPEQPADYPTVHSQISDRPDPESKFGYIVFSIARHGEKLLTETQKGQLDALIEERSSTAINWHDVRNMVRVKAQIAMWDYAGETDATLAAAKQKTWSEWTDLRVAYMEEEFIDKERFQRTAWNILTDSNKQDLLIGKWDKYLKKSTGHGRLFSANKQISRVLGKPDHLVEFASAEAEWRRRWDIMWKAYEAESLFERKREFAMGLADETFSIASWRKNYAPAFRAFAEHESDAIRELLQNGYELDETTREKLGAFQQKLGTDAAAKYDKAPEAMKALFP
jgi:hypothetical protein|tara:strand:- start:25 stop:999 length:975 start_codon:yes stop_codon:yes gene_type:complete